MKNIILLLIITLSVSPQSFSQKTEKEIKIKELLVLTGSADLGVQVGNQLIESFSKAYPDVAKEFWEEFM